MPDTRIDTDLDVAEQHAADLAHVVAQFLHPAVGFNVDRAAIAALAEWRDYCRPSCSFLELGACAMGEDMCGCPCRHDDAATP